MHLILAPQPVRISYPPIRTQRNESRSSRGVNKISHTPCLLSRCYTDNTSYKVQTTDIVWGVFPNLYAGPLTLAPQGHVCRNVWSRHVYEEIIHVHIRKTFVRNICRELRVSCYDVWAVWLRLRGCAWLYRRQHKLTHLVFPFIIIQNRYIWSLKICTREQTIHCSKFNGPLFAHKASTHVACCVLLLSGVRFPHRNQTPRPHSY